MCVSMTKNNLISQEFEASQKFLLKKGKEGLLEISRENVALVEAMIANNSSYNRAQDPTAKPEDKEFLETAPKYWLGKGDIKIQSSKKCKGSTAYWMGELKKLLLSDPEEKLKETILFTVLAIDRENKTRISADNLGPKVLTERIYDYRSTLLEKLKDRKKGFKLIEYLSRVTAEEPIETFEKKYFPRENYSFATKFCHYACFYMFKDEEWQDNYSIYDSVVKKALPDYIKAYPEKLSNLSDLNPQKFNKADGYEQFSEVIDKLRGDVSRNGFDHLLWYNNK